MVLCHVVCAGLQSAMRASSESSQETSTRLASRRSFRSLGLPSSNDILGDWEKMIR